MEEVEFFNGLLRVLDRQRDFIEYVQNSGKTNDTEFKQDFYDTTKLFEKNATLALELVDRHAIGDNASYYRDRLNKLLLQSI